VQLYFCYLFVDEEKVMGLLDIVLGAVTAAQGRNSNTTTSPMGGNSGLGGGNNAALIAAVLAMVAQHASAGRQGAGMTGGASAMGAGSLGGIAELLGQFQRSGLGDVFASWISKGQNAPISGAQIQSALGPDMVAQLAQQLGQSQDATAAQLAEVMPQVVDQLTPNGQVPEGGVGDLDSLLVRFDQQ
jgi:uncharacterized protein YidB (DUF937 family)